MAKKSSKRVRAESDGTVGRPAYELTEEQLAIIDGLCEIQATDEELAVVLDVSRDWIAKKKASDPEFSTRLENKRQSGKSSLRRKQWQLAQKGHPAMLIWLGKQVLGQRDKHEHSGPDGNPVVSRVEVVLVDGETD